MGNKVKYNLKNAHYALLTIAEDGTVSYATPTAIPGSVSISLDANGEPENFYADGIAYYVINNNMGYEGDLELALIPGTYRIITTNRLPNGNQFAWEKTFTEKPEVFTREEKRAWLDQLTGVTLGSDAFFPFADNIERAHKSGVAYIAQPGGSVRDDLVIECCDKYNMVMAFTGIRLFHH